MEIDLAEGHKEYQEHKQGQDGLHHGVKKQGCPVQLWHVGKHQIQQRSHTH